MSDYRQEVEELLSRANAIPFSLARVSLTEEAVRLADLHEDVKLGFRVRQEHIESTIFAGQTDQAIVAFSWCLAQFDHNQQQFPAFTLLWQYKWVACNLTEFPHVSREQIEGMLSDMGLRYDRQGASPSTIWKLRRDVAVDMGDRATAEMAHHEYQKYPRDQLSDCRACELDSHIDYYSFLGNDEQSVAQAKPILEGRASCAEVPHRTYPKLLLPLLRLGRGEEAMRYHRRGYQMIAGNGAKFIRATARHLQWLALTGNFPKGISVLEKELAAALQTVCPGWRFDFFLATQLLLELLAESGRQTVKLRLPDSFPARTDTGRYGLTVLHGWFTGQLNALAAQFDARNGNDYFRSRMDAYASIKELAVRIPLRAPAKAEEPKSGESQVN
jgi:hypothetical protein